MNFIALATCFLLVFCHGARHHKHAPRPQSNVVSPAQSSASPTPQTVAAPGQPDVRGKSCEQITKGFDSWGNSDDWVSGFPVDQQHRALVCLDKLAKRQGLQ